jgi:hypothetical protein
LELEKLVTFSLGGAHAARHRRIAPAITEHPRIEVINASPCRVPKINVNGDNTVANIKGWMMATILGILSQSQICMRRRGILIIPKYQPDSSSQI